MTSGPLQICGRVHVEEAYLVCDVQVLHAKVLAETPHWQVLSIDKVACSSEYCDASVDRAQPLRAFITRDERIRGARGPCISKGDNHACCKWHVDGEYTKRLTLGLPRKGHHGVGRTPAHFRTDNVVLTHRGDRTISHSEASHHHRRLILPHAAGFTAGEDDPWDHFWPRKACATEVLFMTRGYNFRECTQSFDDSALLNRISTCIELTIAPESHRFLGGGFCSLPSATQAELADRIYYESEREWNLTRS